MTVASAVPSLAPENLSGASLLAQAQQAYNEGNYKAVCELLSQVFEGNLKLQVEEQVKSFILMGKCHRETGQFEKARDYFETALAQALSSHDLYHQAEANNQLASLSAMEGDIHKAFALLEDAEQLYIASGATLKQVDVLNNIGYLYLNLSQFEDALEVLKKGFDLLKSNRLPSRTAIINLQNLGLTYKALGRFDRALALYEDARDQSLDLQDPILEVVTLINIAEVQLKQGELSEASTTYEAALQLAVAHDLKRYEFNALLGLGNTFFEKALFARAKASHLKALEIAKAISDKAGELDCLLALAGDDLAIRNYQEATRYAQEALLIAEQTEHVRALADCHQVLARSYKNQGSFERAFFHLEAHSQLETQLFNEKDKDKTRFLSIKFETEKARHEAELYRLRSQVEKEAHEKAKQLVKQRTAELEQAQIEIVTRLAVAAEYRDEDTGEHTHRVGRISALIAYQLGWNLEDVQLLYMAARLHDVGKIGISDTILLKPGKLTDEEFNAIRMHTVIGARILAEGHSPLLKLAEEIALNHHERWNGRGYPAKLTGSTIPQAARIVAVADVLDALTHARPYKEAWTVEAALTEIEVNSGTQFDPEVVAAGVALFAAPSILSPIQGAESWEALTLELVQLSKAKTKVNLVN